MRYLTLSEVLEIHRRIIAQSGAALGVRDLGALEAALKQPQLTFNGADLYLTIIEQASILFQKNKPVNNSVMETSPWPGRLYVMRRGIMPQK